MFGFQKVTMKALPLRMYMLSSEFWIPGRWNTNSFAAPATTGSTRQQQTLPEAS